jgi:hypothetical protein
MDESKLTPSEQVQLGIFKAMAGNQMDGEIAYTLSKSPFGNWGPKPKPASVQLAAPVEVEKTPSGPRPWEPGYAEYYGIVTYPEWTPALQASVEALPNDYVSEQGHSKLDLLQFLKLCKEQTIQDAVESERFNREYEQRQRADAAEAERKRSFGYQFWHRLWNAIFSGFTLGLFLAFFGAWLTLCLWDKPVHGALAGLASAVLYGFFKPVR